MLCKLSTFLIVFCLGLNASAYDLLADPSYVEKPGRSCYDMVQNLTSNYFQKKHVVVHSHISTTQGTYNQLFISVISIDEDYFTVISTGEYSCDNMTVVSYDKVNFPN